MKIHIQRKSHLSLQEQIKRQILALIENQTLLPGQALLPAKDLSNLIHVHRDTVEQTYKELESEGILNVVIGSGTYVRQGLVLKSKKKPDRVFIESVQQALQLGFSKSEIVEQFSGRLWALPTEVMDKQVLVVDCNDGAINYLSKKMLEEFGVETTGMLIQDIEKDPVSSAKLIQSMDVIVCGFNHLEALQAAVPASGVEIIAVLLQVDVRVINALAQLPKGSKIGCACENQRSTDKLYNTLFNSSYFSGGRELKRILVGPDNSKELKKRVMACDTIFVTHFVFDRVKKLSGPDQKLVKVEIRMASSNMALIKEKLFA